MALSWENQEDTVADTLGSRVTLAELYAKSCVGVSASCIGVLVSWGGVFETRLPWWFLEIVGKFWPLR